MLHYIRSFMKFQCLTLTPLSQKDDITFLSSCFISTSIALLWLSVRFKFGISSHETDVTPLCRKYFTTFSEVVCRFKFPTYKCQIMNDLAAVKPQYTQRQ